MELGGIDPPRIAGTIHVVRRWCRERHGVDLGPRIRVNTGGLVVGGDDVTRTIRSHESGVSNVSGALGEAEHGDRLVGDGVFRRGRAARRVESRHVSRGRVPGLTTSHPRRILLQTSGSPPGTEDTACQTRTRATRRRTRLWIRK